MAYREQARAEQGPPACGNIASQSPKINGVVALVISVSIPNPEHSVARTKPAIANLKEEPSEKMGEAGSRRKPLPQQLLLGERRSEGGKHSITPARTASR